VLLRLTVVRISDITNGPRSILLQDTVLFPFENLLNSLFVEEDEAGIVTICAAWSTIVRLKYSFPFSARRSGAGSFGNRDEHRPPGRNRPVSNTVTRSKLPHFPNRCAHDNPAMPPPIIATVSFCSFIFMIVLLESDDDDDDDDDIDPHTRPSCNCVVVVEVEIVVVVDRFDALFAVVDNNPQTLLFEGAKPIIINEKNKKDNKFSFLINSPAR